MSSSRTLAFLLVAGSAAARAQSPAESKAQLCSRAADAHYPAATARAQAMADQGGAEGAFARGCLAMAAQRYDQASDAFARAVTADEGNAVYHYFLGRAYGARAQHANIFKQAVLARKTKAEFERAVALDPDNLDAREGLMTYYLVAPGILGGSVDKARAEAEEIRRRNPYRGGFMFAEIAVHEKDDAGAARELDALTRQFPDSTAPYTLLAAGYAQRKQWPEAWDAAERLLRAHPDAPVAQYAIGRTAAESGEQLDRGAAALARYLQSDPDPGDPPLANAHWRLGQIEERQGRRDAARADYDAAVRLDPQLRPAREALDRLR